jgi:hypothetical protein
MYPGRTRVESLHRRWHLSWGSNSMSASVGASPQTTRGIDTDDVVRTKGRGPFESPWSRVLRLASIWSANDDGRAPTTEEEPLATPNPTSGEGMERDALAKSTGRRRSRRDPSRSSVKTMKARSVLEKLENTENSDLDATEKPWTKNDFCWRNLGPLPRGRF